MYITSDYLKKYPNLIFVYGDNLLRKGKGGAAKLRDEPNTFGFITKKYPNNNPSSFYKPDEYYPVFINELNKLILEIKTKQNNTFLISKLGAGLANKYNIFEKIIQPNIYQLKVYQNITFLF